MRSETPLCSWALAVLITPLFTSIKGNSLQERSDFELPYDVLGPAVFSAAYVAAVGSSSEATTTSLEHQTSTAATLDSSTDFTSTNDKTSPTAGASDSTDSNKDKISSSPTMTGNSAPAKDSNTSTPAKDIASSSLATLDTKGQATSTVTASKDVTSSESSTSFVEDKKSLSPLTSSATPTPAKDQIFTASIPSKDLKSTAESQSLATTDKVHTTPNPLAHQNSTLTASSTTDAKTMGSTISISPSSERANTPSVDISILLGQSPIVLGANPSIQGLAGFHTLSSYDTTGGSLTPVWTPAMLGNAYGGGYVTIPSLYVTNSAAATSATNVLHSKSSTAEGSSTSAVGVPPGYGYTIEVGPSQSYDNSSVPIVIVGLGGTATYFLPKSTSLPSSMFNGTIDKATPGSSTDDKSSISDAPSIAMGGAEQTLDAPGMSQSPGGSSNASIHLPVQPTPPFAFQGLGNKITITFAGGIVGFVIFVFLL